jgi:NAD(P)-dependent dehydrogenase (short-subunit alcohol dehydrogenase family)
MSRPTSFTGKVAVITGAASGMGRSLSLQLAAEGARLAISDVDVVGLAETTAQCRRLGAQVHEQRLDVAQRDAVVAYAATVVAEYDVVNLVINNAGIALSGDVENMGFGDVERIMDVDFWGVVNGTMAFLPHLIASGDGRLVNISSLFGLVAMPGQSAYNAAKFAVRGFTEALRQEMLINGHAVTVTCVHPGGIKTGISRNGRKTASQDASQLDELFEKRLARMTAEKAADIILEAALKKKARVLVGIDAHIIHNAAKFAGSAYQDVVAWGSPRVIPKKK